MFYLYLSIIIIAILLVTIYIVHNKSTKDDDNLMEDVPIINVSRENLEKHASDISSYYSDAKKSNCRRKLIKSLRNSFVDILRGYQYIDKDVANKKEVVPAAEWILDNLYLIEKEYKDIIHNMPSKYYKDLPVINKGIMKGYPRVYHIAVELISHTDGRIDENVIETFIRAYQRNTLLTTGELWALPLMIRIALIQNISKNIKKIIYSQDQKKKADSVSEKILNAIEHDKLDEEIKRLSEIKEEFNSSFTERLLKVLRDNGVDNSKVYKWLDEKLELQQTNTEKMINLEHQKQASFKLSMGNCVTGLREIEALNWRESFEKFSYVEQILRDDPASIYAQMDFESRDYYRHMVEKLSKKSKVSETFIAKKAIELAKKEIEKDNKEVYKTHVGYYLIDDGFEELKGTFGTTRSIFKEIGTPQKRKVKSYIAGIVLTTIILDIIFALVNIYSNNSVFWWEIVLTLCLAFIPCSDIVISIVNWSINSLTTPRFVPKLELGNGIPEEYASIVIIPTLLNNENRVHDLVSDMEIYYLANQESNLYFVLLGDFKDANEKDLKDDKKVVNAALKDIKELNSKYAKDGENIFYFLCRERLYNPSQNLWLGWERKRGKIMEFNSLLRGDKHTTYNTISDDITPLKKAKFVITLDADTQLPRDSAKKLIGAMSHILNRTVINKSDKKVLRGYGLMQPRISVGTISANKTAFSKIFSGETGIDMYTTAISDVYQDLFGEGIFTGKGIYDIDTFNIVLKGHIPENTVLSHDLLEGSYVRTALVSDIELIDGYPAYYSSSSMRLHRWVRGDWQLLPWINKNKGLNLLSRWKVIDNLRRSLISPSIILLVFFSLLLFHNKEMWLVLAFIALLSPLLFDISEAVVAPQKGISLSGKIGNIKTVIEQVLLVFCFLPYQSYLMLDAIIRTLYRVKISKKNMLEWQTAADVEAKLGRKLKNFIQSMWIGSAISIVILLIAFLKSKTIGMFMIPSCTIWFLSPVIAYYISKDKKGHMQELSEENLLLLRKIARKTWAYFEDFVGKTDNWLAPDNYQEEPDKGVAHRTSPTNMAMGLSSGIVAYDMGYLGICELEERTESILENMESLPRIKGHFYNWYNTVTKEPLYPRYISTVDSGNLVGYLMMIAQMQYELEEFPVINKNILAGLKDTALLADEESKGSKSQNGDFYSLISNVSKDNMDVITLKKILIDLWSRAIEFEKQPGFANRYWNLKIKHSVSKLLKEIQKIFPWSDTICDTITEASDRMTKAIERLKEISYKVPIKDACSEYDKVLVMIKKENFKDKEEKEWAEDLTKLIYVSKEEIKKLLERNKNLRDRITNMAESTDFSIVFDKKRQLFSIGYDVESEEISKSYYDLLASESRQASFIAIAKGDVEQKHWFKLSRAMTLMGKNKGLVSWSGTMFEYFMPLLIMKNYPDTLLNETYNAVIEAQQKYCRDRRVPWGISESAFYNFDVSMVYQYKAFGVPGVGLKRGLVNELVISPYSTIMALQIDLDGSLANIQRLISEGLDGRYGFYDAADYTKERIPKGKKKGLVKCFMVHHEGMSFMSLDNVLNNNILQERFHKVPEIKATELLLQEKIPKVVVYDREQQIEVSDNINENQNLIVRNYNTAITDIPETLLLSNGNYSIMLTNSGSGYARNNEYTVYRWREDVTLNNEGLFFYIKNLNSNEYWSATYEPCKDEGENYEVIFSLDKGEFKRKDGNIITHTEISVSNEDNAEVRRISLTNHSEHTRTVEVTSYCEITLAPYNADIVHPAFSNLFIQSEYIDNPGCIIASRRPRSKKDTPKWIMQVTSVEGETVGTLSYETNRLNFIGRGRDLSNPIVMENDAPLKNTVGPVLDPIISIRRRIKIKPGHTVRIAYTTAVADSKEEIIELAKKYEEIQNVNRVFELAWTQTQVEMKYLGIKSTQANLYQLMASKILFISDSLRERENYIKNIHKYQKNLWGYGISGDLPIVLLIISDEKSVHFVRQMLNAHEYWRIKGMKADLVIVNTEGTSYIQYLHDMIRELISSSHARDIQNKSGGVFLYSKSSMPEEDIDFLKAIARLVIDCNKGPIINQICKEEDEEDKAIAIEDKKSIELNIINRQRKKIQSKELNGVSCSRNNGNEDNEIRFNNSLGGFNSTGDKYIIKLKDFDNTPAPWINVISNGRFGFQVSESGSAYTWSENSRENKITPWSNDPVQDYLGEALYLREEDKNKLWSIPPKPIRDNEEYIIEHGFGYSIFKHDIYGIYGEETMFCPLKERIKICCVKLKNSTDTERNIKLVYYAQMVLGVVPQQTAQYIVTDINSDSGYVYAKNPYSEHFGKLLTFLSILGGENASFTGDRKEFIGREGSIEYPISICKSNLSNDCGAGLDPCLTEMVQIKLLPSEEKQIVIILGQGENIEKINKIIEKYKKVENVLEEFNRVKGYWENILHKIIVKTPDESMNIMLNGWLMYQTMVCRLMSRTAFYQSGGAFGFRDQLQDVMAIGYLEPMFTKEQILYSAERQYVEGDVQHWWHTVVNSGIRTRFSDDFLWLPYVVLDYIKTTGDYDLLDEKAPYLEDEPLAEGEDERYGIVEKQSGEGSIYEHCIKAIERALKFGPHNIPLMGSGDWNDGMSTVGNKGRGESVWLGWFLYSILKGFKDICLYKKDNELAAKYEEFQDFIKTNIEANAWDGGWYRRAYFDDGTPLGSAENDECQIDSLAQSWAIISGAGSKNRAYEAMEALERHLVKRDKGLILLLTPAFDKSFLEPGYIKGYVPGVRENGGQYTHAAAWVILAMTRLGNGNKAWQLYNMINPINHSRTYLECEKYMVEPYVMAADVYDRAPHEGRGGWTWYTGASGWMYRIGIEGILGLKFEYGKGFRMEPCIPDEWCQYEILYNREECQYEITVTRGETKGLTVDGTPALNDIVPFYKSGKHKVEVII